VGSSRFHFLCRLKRSLLFVYVTCRNRKDLKKVAKLEAQVPYHQGRGNMEEVEKIKEQVAGIWEKAREAALA
jgi:hypothetical protein